MDEIRSDSSDFFRLETAIANWRHQFRFDRKFSSADLDEMERHLRDQVEDLVRSGASEKSAFAEALSEMGDILQAESEYGKVHWSKVRRERRELDELRAWWAMVTNYAKLGYRNLRRDKVPSIINIAGMSIALSVCIVVYLFLTAWNTMDSFHEHGDRIFFAQHVIDGESGRETWGRMPIPLGPAMEADIPEIERAVRLNWYGVTVNHDGQVFDEVLAFVDEGFFDMLTFPLRDGSSEALADPGAVILSDKMASKYFGDADPVGRTLTLVFDRREKKEVTVGGVAAPFPSNIGLRWDILMGFDRQAELGLVDLSDWAIQTSGMLVEVEDAGQIASVKHQMGRYLERVNAANPDRPVKAFTFDNLADPSPDAYRVRGRISEAADPSVTIFFVTIALFMLALACFNYINIAVGSASRRFNEIGMRKAMGGSRRQLIQQFITENLIMCTVSLALAVLVAKFFLVPLQNSLFILQTDGLSFTGNPGLWAFLGVLLVSVAFISGAYPALYVSSFETISIFKGRQALGNNAWLTRAFLTFQFVLAFTTVILGVALTMNSRYLIKQDWGYDPGDTVVVELQEATQFGPLRDELTRRPEVVAVAGAADHVGRGVDRINLNAPSGESHDVIRYRVGPGYLESVGLRLRSGRLFSADHPSDLTDGVVINERLAVSQGWEEPIGQTIRLGDRQYSVIGVVDDFSFFLLAHPVPAVFTSCEPASFGYLVLKVRDGADGDVEKDVEEAWSRLYPDASLRQFRQSEVFDATYTQYNNVTRAFDYIAGLALLIACMGLFGLALQNISRRLKEYSVRKVIGASVPQLILLANRGFIGMLAVAATIATAICIVGLNVLLMAVREVVPIAHMPITPLPFTVAYVVVLGSAVIAVAVQILKLMRSNPAEVLRAE